MVVETVIPVSKQFFVGQVEKKLGKAGNIPDTILSEYDEFDDYLEMVIQFGVSVCHVHACGVCVCVLVCPCAVFVCSSLYVHISSPSLPPSLPLSLSLSLSTLYCLRQHFHWEQL